MTKCIRRPQGVERTEQLKYLRNSLGAKISLSATRAPSRRDQQLVNPQPLYIALFGRPADPGGLAWLNDITNGGTEYASIGVLASSPEFNVILNSSDDRDNLDRNYIAQMYQNMFDRSADLEGLEFYLSLHREGGDDLPTIAMKMAAAAGGVDALTLSAKIEAADLFTSYIDTAAEVKAYEGVWAASFGWDFINGIDAGDPALPNFPEYVEAQVELLVSQPGIIVN